MPTWARTACTRGPRRRACPRQPEGNSGRASRAPHPRARHPGQRGPVMHRRAANGIEQLAAARPGKGTERHGRVRRPEGRRADFRHRLVQRFGDEAQRRHVGGLALVRGHAGGGVALDVLDRLEALAHGKADILGGDIVLQIDEGAAAARRIAARHDAHRAEARSALACRECARPFEPCRGGPGSPTLLEARGKLIGARGGAGRALGLHGTCRDEGVDRRIEAEAFPAIARTNARPASSHRTGRRNRSSACARCRPPLMRRPERRSGRRRAFARAIRRRCAPSGLHSRLDASFRPPRHTRPPAADRRASPPVLRSSGPWRRCRRMRPTWRSRRAALAPRRSD